MLLHLSIILFTRGGVGLPLDPGGMSVSGSGGVHPPGRHPPPQADIPPPPRRPLQRTVRTHPTGMHSCSQWVKANTRATSLTLSITQEGFAPIPGYIHRILNECIYQGLPEKFSLSQSFSFIAKNAYRPYLS